MSTPTEKNIRLLVMLMENPLGYTIDEIKDRLEIARSTVYKYVRVIKDCNIDVETAGGRIKVINLRLVRHGRNINTVGNNYFRAQSLLGIKIKFKK